MTINVLTNLWSIVVDGYLHGESVSHSQTTALPLSLSNKANGDKLQQWLPAKNLLVS